MGSLLWTEMSVRLQSWMIVILPLRLWVNLILVYVVERHFQLGS